MYVSGQNLLYTFHQSLTAQHVTVGMFKRYARSPEQRTFKNYFRKTNPFTKYMHQRPQNSLGRYITKHRRKKNPILTNFTTRITTTILEKLQNLQIHNVAILSAVLNRNAGFQPTVLNRNAGFQPAVFNSQNNPGQRRHSPARRVKAESNDGRQEKKTQNKPISMPLKVVQASPCPAVAGERRGTPEAKTASAEACPGHRSGDGILIYVKPDT